MGLCVAGRGTSWWGCEGGNVRWEGGEVKGDWEVWARCYGAGVWGEWGSKGWRAVWVRMCLTSLRGPVWGFSNSMVPSPGGVGRLTPKLCGGGGSGIGRGRGGVGRVFVSPA